MIFILFRRLVKDGTPESIITLGCDDGDHIGCGVYFDPMLDYKNPASKTILVQVFFTKNGKEVSKRESVMIGTAFSKGLNNEKKLVTPHLTTLPN